MADVQSTLIVEDILDVDKLLTQRQWSLLREGVHISPIYAHGDDGAMAAFLHYEPGAEVLEHRHLGFEHIIVLAGSQADDRHEYGCGSLIVQPPGSSHSVVSEEGCIVLAIWEKPVRFV